MIRPIARLQMLLTVLCFCAACSTQVVPVPTATALLDPGGTSLTEVRDGVAITVRLDQESVQPAQLVDNLTAFHLTIDNRTERAVTVSTDTLLLKDGAGRQYRSITPERVREIVSKDTVYLIPYPYVGYYYLEDQARGAAQQAMASSLPFYAEYHPQDIFTRALPAGAVLPHAKVAGVVYFLIDLTATSRAELLIFQDSRMQDAPRYRFPFGVKK
jgi:hypothetical protein